VSANLKISVAIVAAFVGVLAVVLLAAGSSSGGPVQTVGNGGDIASETAGDTSPAAVVRPNSHRLSTAADTTVTFVEFLDFECESCRAAYPSVEALREEYGDRVTFVVRYFPVPGHVNGERAAIAVEAAAAQGSFEAMYRRMFETQSEWGEQQVPQDGVFRGFAEDLGLDLAAFDRAVADPATAERVREDRADGLALGVSGTPTFFLNGVKIAAASYEDLQAQLDAALSS
jgi:protein-disulfide isomerase